MAESSQTIVHIAAEPDGLSQRCLRCHAILIDARGCMTVGAGTVTYGCWQPGAFVGVLELPPVDGVSRSDSFQMTHDAATIYEIACNAKAN